MELEHPRLRWIVSKCNSINSSRLHQLAYGFSQPPAASDISSDSRQPFSPAATKCDKSVLFGIILFNDYKSVLFRTTLFDDYNFLRSWIAILNGYRTVFFKTTLFNAYKTVLLKTTLFSVFKLKCRYIFCLVHSNLIFVVVFSLTKLNFAIHFFLLMSSFCLLLASLIQYLFSNIPFATDQYVAFP